MKIQNHSVIFEWCDPYYVYILPIFPKKLKHFGRPKRLSKLVATFESQGIYLLTLFTKY